MKYNCDNKNCNNFAVWFYEGSANKQKYCDNCIPKGRCSCSLSYETDEQMLDEFGTPYPCVDFVHYNGGIYKPDHFDEYREFLSEEEIILIEKVIYNHHWYFDDDNYDYGDYAEENGALPFINQPVL